MSPTIRARLDTDMCYVKSVPLFRTRGLYLRPWNKSDSGRQKCREKPSSLQSSFDMETLLVNSH